MLIITSPNEKSSNDMQNAIAIKSTSSGLVSLARLAYLRNIPPKLEKLGKNSTKGKIITNGIEKTESVSKLFL